LLRFVDLRQIAEALITSRRQADFPTVTNITLAVRYQAGGGRIGRYVAERSSASAERSSATLAR
jgi:hypothetical protein